MLTLLRPFRAALLCALTLVIACDGGADGAGADGGLGDAGGEACLPRAADVIPEAGQCAAADGDFAPCADDGWDSCVSDDGRYHRVQPTISSAGRVAAFEEIADLLFDPTADADGDTFLAARLIYQRDEGLDSRVVRRYDPHFEVPADTDCTAEGTPEIQPDYCVGPARIAPLLLDALNAGIAGTDARANAARVEAGLLWFLYVSTAKEGLTCTKKAKDCDSAYAYYTGGETARGGIGLARYVSEVDPYAHDRAWDGLLAVRCWRDLDDAEVAEDLELRDRARDQYDRALLDGLAALVLDRLAKYEAAEAAADAGQRAYYAASVRTLGGVLDRAVRERSAGDADRLAEALAADTLGADVVGEVLADSFDCP